MYLLLHMVEWYDTWLVQLYIYQVKPWFVCETLIKVAVDSYWSGVIKRAAYLTLLVQFVQYYNQSLVQNNDDACLTYTLAAICNLLFETGTSRHSIGVIGSPHSLGTSTGMGTPSSTQQLLLVLLKRSLKRADSLKLTSLLAHNRLTLAKFDLKVSLRLGLLVMYTWVIKYCALWYNICFVPKTPISCSHLSKIIYITSVFVFQKALNLGPADFTVLQYY